MPKVIVGHLTAQSRALHHEVFPYDFGGAGDINSTIEDMARWVRLQLGNGSFEGHRIVSPENRLCRTPKVAISDKYPTRWVGLSNRPKTATSFGIMAVPTALAPLSAWRQIKALGLLSSPTRRMWVFRMRSDYGLWTEFSTIPKSTT